MKKTSFLFLRFPYQSSFGGEEKVHLQMADILFKNGVTPLFFGSCTVLSKHYIQKKYKAYSLPLIRDITAKIPLLLSPLFIPFFFVLGFFVLGFFKYIHHTQKILCMSYIEKIAWTLPSRILGIEVFWAHHAPLGDWFWKNPYKPLWEFLSRWAHIIVPSQSLKNQLISGCKISSRTPMWCTVIHNGIPIPDISSPRPISPENTKIHIGSASRLSPEKNIISVIPLAEQFPEVSFVVAGTGSEEVKIQTKAKEKDLSNIEFLGFLHHEHMNKFFQNIDILYFPSFQEPFGLIAAEAMLHNTIILTSAVDGIPEVIGEYGFRFSLSKENHAAKILQKILALSDKEKNKILREGRKWITNNFSEEIFTKKTEEIFL